MISFFSRVFWVGRATVFLVGLAVILAVVLGVAATALAGTGVGDPFHLGKLNSVNAVSRLVGSVDGPMLMVNNNSTRAGAHALNLQVDQGNSPMKVNAAAGKATNLNADKIDGKDSTQFAPATVESWHEIGTTGEPAFGSNSVLGCTWQNYGGEYDTAGFYKDPYGVVHLKGLIKAVDASATSACSTSESAHVAPFSLPPGYRPAKRMEYAVIANDALGRVGVIGNNSPLAGAVFVNVDGVGSKEWVSLNGITFRAAP